MRTQISARYSPRVLRLGPFELLEPIARGGMGQVWRGRHVEHELPVAIKVIDAKRVGDAAVQHAFAREVRAMARLVHPRIVVILDHRIMDADCAAGTAELVEGSPTITMELGVETLGPWLRRKRRPWRDTRDVLLQILDALAHSHARSVIHRDLKPANLLRFGTDDAPLWKVTDFGIAFSAGDAADTVGSGTPAFMPPEQIIAKNRDIGPWTDLYALGCLAWWMTTGARPYRGSAQDVLRSHCQAPLPAFRPHPGVPPSMGEWLRHSLAKSINTRFQRAADAAWALTQLDGERLLPSAGFDVAATVELSGTSAITLPEGQPTRVARQAAYPVSPPAPRPPSNQAFPDFRQREATPPPLPMLGAGLGLFGLREIPMTGRQAVRDALWTALHHVAQQRSAALRIVHGAAGHGKSRLARWLCERAHELGIAEFLVARHGSPASAADGFAPMLDRTLRCTGLPRAGVAERVNDWLGPDYDRLARSQLTELIRPRAIDDPFDGLIDASDSDSRQAAVGFAFTRLARDRPLIVWIDDAQWGAEATGVAARYQDEREPVLFLLTVRDDARGASREASHHLASVPAASWIHVPPLDREERIHLVSQLLRLDARLAEAVDARTEGNPLFAVQLVGDWVRRQILVVGERGFELAAGASPQLPGAIRDLWSTRVDDLVFSGAERETLEIAALLGQEVDARQWAEACQSHGLSAASDLRERLFGAGLASPSETGWRFVHNMLSEALCLDAQVAGRADAQAAACLDALRRSGRALLKRGRIREAEELLARAMRLPTPGAQITARWLHGESLRLLGQTTAARSELEGALLAAREAGDRATEAHILANLGTICATDGTYEEALALYLQAMEIHREEGDLVGEGLGLDHLGGVYRRIGAIDAAIDSFHAALTIHQRLENRHFQAATLNNLAAVHRNRGATALAALTYADGLKLAREVGARRSEGLLLEGLAILHQNQGHLEEAERCYRTALAIARETGGHASEGATLANLASLYQSQGRADEALPLTEQALAVLRDMRHHYAQSVVLGNLGELHLQSGNLELAREALTEGHELASNLGGLTTQGVITGLLAELRAREGDTDGATTDLETAIAILRRSGDAVELGKMLCRQAKHAIGCGDRMLAQHAVEQATQLAASAASEPTSELASEIACLRTLMAGDANDPSL